MYDEVPMVCEWPEVFKPQEIFTVGGDYLGICVDFFLPFRKKTSLRVAIGNHVNDGNDAPFNTNFFAFVASLQEVFEAYLAHHRHDGDCFENDDCCQDYHQEWARWLREYADRLEKHCLAYAWQQRKP